MKLAVDLAVPDVASIYISSTYTDLKAHREAVHHALHRLRHQVVAMEDYVAADDRPLILCLKDVESCDLYVGILAWRYGFIPADQNPDRRSITELEYRHATELGKPRLIFLVGDDAPWPPKFVDKDEDARSIRALREELTAAHHVSVFGTEDQLAALVTAAVANWERTSASDSRRTRLDRLANESRGRCIERWQAAGLERALAFAFADDRSVGAPPSHVRPAAERPLVIAVGDFGAGKSLYGERLLQIAIERCRTDEGAPIPIYLEPPLGAVHSLSDVRERAQHLGDVDRLGAALVLERADEGGAKHARQCLALARRAISTWPTTTVFLPTRSLPWVHENDEAVNVPLLDRLQACQLVSRVTGTSFSENDFWAWSDSIRESVRWPLFAILLGIYLRSRHSEPNEHLSPAELINDLVDRALTSTGVEFQNTRELLMRTAALSTARGGEYVGRSELGPPIDLGPLLNSGLVSARDDAIGFAIPILREWFAAQALASGGVKPEDILSAPESVDLWFYPLAVMVASNGWEVLERVFSVVVEHQPGVASQVLDEACGRHRTSRGATKISPLDSAKRLREAMQHWVHGLGDLARHVAPITANGQVRPLGVAGTSEWTTLSWYGGTQLVPAVVPLEEPVGRGWNVRTSLTPGAQPTWAWQRSLEELTQQVDALLDARYFLPRSLELEQAWAMAARLTNHRPWDGPRILLSKIQPFFERQSPDLLARGCRSVDWSLLTRTMEGARATGSDVLIAPLPMADRRPEGTRCFVWDVYSDEQLLARTRAAYVLALKAYLEITAQFFAHLSPRLLHAATLPARLVGVLHPAESDPLAGAMPHGPSLHYYFEPLPTEAASVVEITMGSRKEAPVVDLQALSLRFAELRCKKAPWAYAYRSSQILDVMFRDEPITDIVYNWLASDLKAIKWASRTIV